MSVEHFVIGFWILSPLNVERDDEMIIDWAEIGTLRAILLAASGLCAADP